MSADTVTLGPRAVGDHPLTNVQRQIWTSQRLSPEAPLANMGKVHRISGAIEPDRFVAAVDEVVRTSDALRTVIVDRPGREPRARVLYEPPRSTEVLDLPEAELEAWCADRIARPIDARTCSYDSVLLRHDDDSWTWWLDLHHVVIDGWAASLVYDAVSRAYAGEASGEAISFYEFVDDAFGGDVTSSAVAEGAPIAPYGPRAERTTRVGRHELTDAATRLAPHPAYRAFGPSMATLGLLAVATAVTLSRLDGRSTITLGVPLHRRHGPTAAQLIGPLMAVYPMAVEVDLDESFADAYKRVLRQLVGVLRSTGDDDVPDAGFDAVLNVQTVTYGDFAGFPTVTTWARSGHVDAAHPIRVHAFDYGSGMTVEVDLNDSLSIDGSHPAFVEHLSCTLETALLDPAGAVGDFEIATATDLAAMAQLNPPGRDADGSTEANTEGKIGQPVHQVIARLLRSDPVHVVAEHDGEELTAGELDRRADAVALELIRRGITTGARVGIRLPRSFDVLVAVHGVMRSGAAFVMLDPDDPAARHEAIAADADLALIVDDVADLVAGADGPSPGDGSADVAAPVEVGLDDIAYVLYTSGSTGLPKGVPIPHRGLADYLAFAAAAYVPTSAFVMPLYSSLGFDLSITSLFLPQLVGGRTVVFADDAVTALGRIAADPGLTVMKATPSQIEILNRLATEPLPLEVVIVGGEAFRRPVAESLTERCARDVRIFNEYGPTEAVVGCMIHEWDPGRDRGPDVPIGHASPGAEVYVLDERRCRTPVGAWGELYVRRPGMAQGYLGLPDATAERFVVVEDIGGPALYRTGDRVRMERGALVYGGRIDDQLSVGGVRLEPGEIEAALMAHPGVTSAVVRVWSPAHDRLRRCTRCGLGTDVPGVDVDDAGLCSVCRSFDLVAPQTTTWFREPSDLDRELERARERSTSEYDCIHLLSGGKDSTYALYQLVARGWRVHAFTLDNGFISDGAKENIRRSVADLGITHEFATTEAMNEIFRDSLERFSNVCNGCYKTIYTLATARAHEMGIPVIVTGLSRGQFFETRLIPHQFEADRFEPDDIDRTVLQARRAYHHTHDAVTELLPEQAVFERTDIDVLDEVEFIDFYRYVDVELAEMYDFLTERAPWVRPDDTGRSTNCLVNAAGIHVHKTERGYHNYAEPYSWDVRLGHKTRDEALDELDDDDEQAEIERMLAEIGYVPTPPHVLTAWYQTTDGGDIDARLLAAHLRELLPSRAVPTAYVHVRDLPLAESTKLDVSSLPAPSTSHLGSASYRAPTTPTEAQVAGLWAAILQVDRVGVDDDFFDLGGASLSALETVAATERQFSIELPDALVFEHRTLTDFAAAVDGHIGGGRQLAVIPELDPARPVPLSPGEEAMLFEYRADPTDVRYNVARWYQVRADLDPDRLREAVERVVARHGPLHTSYAPTRHRLAVDDALAFEPLPDGPVGEFVDQLRRRPFDLEHGPLVRVNVGPGDHGRWHVVIGLHHISVDAGTFDLLWDEIDAAYHRRELPELSTPYAAYGAWQRDRAVASSPFWAEPHVAVAGVQLPPPERVEEDGYLEQPATVSTSELSRAASSTPFAAALAAAAVVLSGFSRDGVVDLGVTASTKDHPSADPLVGYALNTLPLRLEVDSDVTLRTLDVNASGLVAHALPHRTFPFAEIVREARLDGRTVPDVSHMLAYERLAPVRFGDTTAAHRNIAPASARNDLTFYVQERDDDLRLGIEYRGAVLGAELAQELLDGFNDAIDAMCRRPHRTIGDVRRAGDDLVGPPLSSDLDVSTPLASIIRWATTEPARPAVVESSGAITSYGELLARSRRLAAALRSQIGSPARVGVSLGRSSTLIEALVGVQLAGAAYVPIDPATPPHRVEELVELASLDAVVVDANTAELFIDVPRIDVSQALQGDAVDDPAAIEPPGADSAAYVIFTSGSTGEPAGVEVTHANLAASTAARPHFYGPTPPSRFLLTPSIGFDSSMVGIWWPLMSGGSIVLPDDDEVHDVDRLGALIADRDVSHLLMVPSLYRALLARRPADLSRLRAAIVAGEACTPDLVDQHHRLLASTDLVNEYGPTESTVWATAHRCAPGDDPVPIGRPIAGTRIRVADGHQRRMAPGAAGELLIAGPGVVDGYVSGRSDASFVELDGDRWYRTGDIARVDDRGRLVFLGRVDDQLNVGGYRIEPVEVESQIVRLAGARDAVVVGAMIDGREALVAHVVGDRRLVDAAQVRAHVAALIGAGAAPRRVVFHDDLPRTANGKLDRARAALLPVDNPPAGPSSGLLDIWRRALQRDDLDGSSDFFAEGGDSLAAVEIVIAVGEMIGREVTVAAILNASTPDALAVHLGLDGAGERSAAPEAAVGVLTLRAGSPTGPTVVVTPSWDDVLAYRVFADAFDDDVTVLAVAVVSDDSGPSTLPSVEALGIASIDPILAELAARNVSTVTLVGWSTGGVAAYDLGQRLAVRGIEVTAVVLVDTMFPGEHHHLWSNRWWKYKSLLRPDAMGTIAGEFATAMKRRAKKMIARLGRRLIVVGGESVPAVEETTASGVPLSALDHDPEPTAVPIVLYAADTSNRARTEHRWRTVAPDLLVVPIEGRHRGFDSIMGADRVHQITDDLTSRLNT